MPIESSAASIGIASGKIGWRAEWNRYRFAICREETTVTTQQDDMARTKKVLAKLLDDAELSPAQELLTATALDHLQAGRLNEAIEIINRLTD